VKRTGRLFEALLGRDNLRAAAHQALKGKRTRQDARTWLAHLDANLARMTAQLADGTFPLGRFHQFVIHDPKERIITAPCFEERVLHHALMNVCEPHLERWLIFDTYACRKGKGRVAALQRARQFAGRYSFFLKMDIRKFFDSIPHDELLDRWRQRFKDERLNQLLEAIVRSYRGQLGCGLPIGSLTSQHGANFYLGWFDRFVKERLGIPGYVRYMDDLALWSNDLEELRTAEEQSRRFLADDLALLVKPTPYRNRTTHGMDFLGCRIFRNHLVLNRRSRVRFRRKLRHLELAWLTGVLDEAELQGRATALTAFVRSAGLSSWRYRSRVLYQLPVSGPEARTG
jgi:RNA-directed DNA polymerase